MCVQLAPLALMISTKEFSTFPAFNVFTSQMHLDVAHLTMKPIALTLFVHCVVANLKHPVIGQDNDYQVSCSEIDYKNPFFTIFPFADFVSSF